MLTVEKINTFYGEAHTLFDVTLEIQEGEVVALLGRNGAGKTTTIRSIMGLTPPRAGKIIFKGENIAGLPPYAIANKGVGFVPDNRRIFPNLTVKRNLEIARKGNGEKEGWTIGENLRTFPKAERDRIPNGGGPERRRAADAHDRQDPDGQSGPGSSR